MNAQKKNPVKTPVSADTLLYWQSLIVKPVVTEKSTAGSIYNQITFQVVPKADKHGIKAAIEGLFAVDVVKVNTLNQRGKVKTHKGRKGRRNHTKKAIITLAEGQNIDLGMD